MNLNRTLGALLCASTVAAVPVLLTGCGKSADQAKARLAKANVSFTPDDFVRAAGQGDVDLLGLFLQAGMDKNAQDARGWTALMKASEAGHKKVVKALLQYGAKTELTNADGSTALILAAGNDHHECVRALIDSAADVNAKNAKGWTALAMAAYRGHAKTTEVLLKTSRDALAKSDALSRALMVSALLGHADIARLLLDAGAPVNTTIEKQQTALMFAAMGAKKDLVQLLLSRGADTALMNQDGSTASILALQKGHTEIAKIIDTYAANTPQTTNRSTVLAAAPAAPAPVAPSAAAAPAAPAKGSSPAPASGLTPPTLTASPSAKPGQAVGPAPKPVADPAVVAQADANAARLEQTFLKERKVDPQALLAVDTGQDSDGDGWTDSEEVAYGSNPNDPGSHPPLHTKLRMAKLDAQPFPVVFEGVEGKRAVITIQHGQLSERHVLAVGNSVPGEGWKVAGIRPRRTVDKSGTTLDVSELVLQSPSTGEKLVLVKSMLANAPGGSATLSLEGMDREIQVKEKQVFALGPDESERYTVLDIRPTQVVLKVHGTGDVITVTMREPMPQARR
ncbi:MAG: ankyrin repeat domain-containing protein [Verrucomicrobia bacterium]|nr:ankyrin repeat domain-containing protein [Verrucomicrobiota bacterium]